MAAAAAVSAAAAAARRRSPAARARGGGSAVGMGGGSGNRQRLRLILSLVASSMRCFERRELSASSPSGRTRSPVTLRRELQPYQGFVAWAVRCRRLCRTPGSQPAGRARFQGPGSFCSLAAVQHARLQARPRLGRPARALGQCVLLLGGAARAAAPRAPLRRVPAAPAKCCSCSSRCNHDQAGAISAVGARRAAMEACGPVKESRRPLAVEGNAWMASCMRSNAPGGSSPLLGY